MNRNTRLPCLTEDMIVIPVMVMVEEADWWRNNSSGTKDDKEEYNT